MNKKLNKASRNCKMLTVFVNLINLKVRNEDKVKQIKFFKNSMIPKFQIKKL